MKFQTLTVTNLMRKESVLNVLLDSISIELTDVAKSLMIVSIIVFKNKDVFNVIVGMLLMTIYNVSKVKMI